MVYLGFPDGSEEIQSEGFITFVKMSKGKPRKSEQIFGMANPKLLGGDSLEGY